MLNLFKIGKESQIGKTSYKWARLREMGFTKVVLFRSAMHKQDALEAQRIIEAALGIPFSKKRRGCKEPLISRWWGALLATFLSGVVLYPASTMPFTYIAGHEQVYSRMPCAGCYGGLHKDCLISKQI